MAEQNKELLMKNHESCATGSAPLSEANMVAYNQNGGHGRGRGSDRGRARPWTWSWSWLRTWIWPP
ncbi:hypothetical protein Tco_0172099, partial [Tanacetum coccineum]